MHSMETEEWRPVPSLESRVEVSSLGGIRKVVPGGYKYAKAGERSSGEDYLRWGFEGRMYLVHRLVCEAFHGPPPPGKTQVLHWDDDKRNNRPDNLRWGSPRDNANDAIRNFGHWQSDKTHCPKGHPYSEDNVYPSQKGHRKCIVCSRQVRKNRPPLKEGDLRHGTVGGYTNHRCRCKRCREAATEDSRKRRSKK